MTRILDFIRNIFYPKKPENPMVSSINTQKIELNGQFKKALYLMENTSKNLFITGKAGTGKSTLLSYFREHTKKQIAYLAPTGVAALNIKGQTIHSFFGWGPNINIFKIIKKDHETYRKLDTIIIDEASMLRADILDCIDKFLRINGKNKGLPFGGIQMILIGDLYQLPPVVTSNERKIFEKEYNGPYFFNAHIMKKINLEFIELEKIYRQKDIKFIELLNLIRNNSIDENDLNSLNKRYNQNFQNDTKNFYITLATTNEIAGNLNREELSKLKNRKYILQGYLEGDFEKEKGGKLPTDLELEIKEEAQIMFLNNDSQKRWVNGTMGKIVKIKKHNNKADSIRIELQNGQIVNVFKHTWEIFNFYYNKKDKRIDSKIVGRFVQYPFKLAWAVTIHKSQGKTFDNVIIDIGRGTFAHGQMYVALSRCTNFDGIILRQPIRKWDIKVDRQIIDFLTKFQYEISEKQITLDEKIRIIDGAINTKNNLDITYLKLDDTKSQRLIAPLNIGEMEYCNKKFLGLRAFCHSRKAERVFRVDRILDLRR